LQDILLARENTCNRRESFSKIVKEKRGKVWEKVDFGRACYKAVSA